MCEDLQGICDAEYEPAWHEHDLKGCEDVAAREPFSVCVCKAHGWGAKTPHRSPSADTRR